MHLTAPASGDHYYLSDGSTSDGSFDFTDGDELFVGGLLKLSDGTFVSEFDPDLNIIWYDGNDVLLTSGTRSYIVENSVSDV